MILVLGTNTRINVSKRLACAVTIQAKRIEVVLFYEREELGFR